MLFSGESHTIPEPDHYFKLWHLTGDGEILFTHSGLLTPVLYRGTEAMLKIAFSPEEKRGGKLLSWWKGQGAAKVFAYDENALVMERLHTSPSLKEMALDGRDDEATRIICGVAARLHAHEKTELPELTPLSAWFRDLFRSREKYGAIVTECASLASLLVENQSDMTVLHGDLHHENILYGSSGQWLAIDPKGLWGERTFEYANILCNPDKKTALGAGRFSRQVDVICETSGVSRIHLLQWTAAWAALSAVWFINDNMDPDIPLAVAEKALAEL